MGSSLPSLPGLPSYVWWAAQVWEGLGIFGTSLRLCWWTP